MAQDGSRDQVLYRVSQVVLAVARQQSVHDVLQMIVRSARSLADARYAALGVPDDHGGFAEFVVDGIPENERKAIGPLPRQHGMLGVLLREGQPLRLADIRADPRFEGWPDAHPELKDILGVPIKDDSAVLGIIFAPNAGRPGGFTQADEELLALLLRTPRSRSPTRDCTSGCGCFRCSRSAVGSPGTCMMLFRRSSFPSV